MAAAAVAMTVQDAENAVARMFGDSETATASGLFGGKEDTVKVAARIRPMSAKEISMDPRQAVTQVGADGIRCALEETDTHFQFDRVFSSFISQDTVFDELGAPMVDAVMNGINGAVIAYGQTGSGKTFTMEGGEDEDMGMIPRIFSLLFRRLKASRSKFDVRCTCVEIYNERVFDLITYGKGGVDIWEDESKGLTLTGATEVPVFTAAAALTLFRQAVKNRKTYETNMNAVSSRSHCVFILTIAKQAPGETATTFCQLYLADLAGSERVAKTGAAGKRLDEAKYINKSLLSLGLVIGALADEDTKKHVPYRDSKLTRLLQNSLGGNSRTVLIVTLSPSAWNAGESLGALRFGALSSRIQNTAVANKVVSETQLSDMIAVARERRARNDVLLRRCEENVAQLFGLFDALGISHKEIHALAGKGLGVAEHALAAAEAVRKGAGVEEASVAASGAGASVAAAVSSAAADSAGRGRRWEADASSVAAPAAASASTARPRTAGLAAGSASGPAGASASGFAARGRSVGGATAASRSSDAAPLAPHSPADAASPALGSRPLRGRATHRPSSAASSRRSSGDDALSGSRSRSRSRTTRKRTDAFLERMARHEQEKLGRRQQRADVEFAKATGRALNEGTGLAAAADYSDDAASDSGGTPSPAASRSSGAEAASPMAVRGASSGAAPAGIAASPERRAVPAPVAGEGPSSRPPKAVTAAVPVPAGERLHQQARLREEKRQEALERTGRVVYSRGSRGQRSRSRSTSGASSGADGSGRGRDVCGGSGDDNGDVDDDDDDDSVLAAPLLTRW